VVVTVNHRLNVFGYLHLAALGGHPASGNAGMLDLVAVLEWVRDNIAAFGGDPGRVTCFGQSGGGGKTSTMMAMPAAKGLFKGAIIQSGASLRAGDPDRATESARNLMRALGISNLAALKQVPYEKILTTLRDPQAMGGRGGAGFGTVLDGAAIPAHPFDPVANPLARDVAVMVGCTTDEQVMYNIGADWWGKLNEAELAERLRPQYGDKTGPVIAAAKARYPKDNPSYLYTDIISKGSLFGSTTLAERKAAQPAPVYVYLWEWAAPVDGGVLRAPHTMELPFVFDNVALGPILLGKDKSTFQLGKQASTAWTSFAKTGDPNARGTGLPTWPKFDPKARPVMVFNTKSRVEMDPYAEFKALQPTRGGPGPV
jgi:para-nitrobenzyl esterase